MFVGYVYILYTIFRMLVYTLCYNIRLKFMAICSQYEWARFGLYGLYACFWCWIGAFALRRQQGLDGIVESRFYTTLDKAT